MDFVDVASIINRCNQLNPNNWRYWKSRGYLDRPENWMLLLHVRPEVGGLQYLLLQPRCCHGGWLNICKLCCLKGAVATVTAISIAYLCYTYRKEIKEYALKGLNGTIHLSKRSAHFVQTYSIIFAKYSAKVARDQGPNIWYYGVVVPYCSVRYVAVQSMILAEYSAKFAINQAPNIWYYGAVVPYSVAKTGVYYSAVGLKKFAAIIGYYCGSYEEPQKEEPQKAK